MYYIWLAKICDCIYMDSWNLTVGRKHLTMGSMQKNMEKKTVLENLTAYKGHCFTLYIVGAH